MYPFEMDEFEKKMGEKFVCAKCGNKGGKAIEIATTGTGLSKLLDIQHNKFISVSCLKCGFTELYNINILQNEKFDGMDIFDVLFG